MNIIFGNIKGGNGKSTLAVHVAIDLLYRGFEVICIDCDGGQGTMSRYWENRKNFCRIMAQHQEAAEKNGLRKAPLPHYLGRLCPKNDHPEMLQALMVDIQEKHPDSLVIVDTAGYDSALSRFAHGLSDILVTPMNDSAIDLDLLVNVTDSTQLNQLPLSQYALLVWEQRMKRASHQDMPLDWMIVRNRMHNFSSKNQVQLEKILLSLSERIGFHLAPSLSERVIFRELFGYGLTVLDHKSLPPSHQSAFREIRAITDTMLKLIEKRKRDLKRGSTFMDAPQKPFMTGG